MRGRSHRHPVDLAIGEAIRRVRKSRGLTQEGLAEGIGVTFQQVQKYEQGVNRVSCSMLLEICGQLEAHPMDILPSLPFISSPVLHMQWFEDARSVYERTPSLLEALARLNRLQLQAILATARAFG